MTKKSIRRGTIITMAMAVAAFIAISLLSLPSAEIRSDEVARQTPRWSDSLSNSRSDIPELRQMDAEIQRFIDRWDIRGFSLAVSRHDSLLYAKGYGMADVEKGEKMEPTHIMRIASVSKLVTAVGVMHLVDRGVLSLDSKVFGPDGVLNDEEYSSEVADKRIFDITVRDLLLHAGGFGRGAGDPMFTTHEIMKAHHLSSPPDARQLIKIVLRRKLAFAPGHGRRYSNFGYMLLSEVVARKGGSSYWQYMTDSVLSPMNIHNFRPATNYYSQKLPRESRYYGTDHELVEEYNNSGRMVERIYGGSDFHALQGAGGWLASPAELARMVAQIDGDPSMKDFLSKAAVDSMTQYGEKEKKAMGWVQVDEHGKWTRTGTLSSTSALIEKYPDGECWVAVTNTGIWTGSRFSRDLSRFLDHLRARYSDKLPSRNLFYSE